MINIKHTGSWRCRGCCCCGMWMERGRAEVSLTQTETGGGELSVCVCGRAGDSGTTGTFPRRVPLLFGASPGGGGGGGGLWPCRQIAPWAPAPSLVTIPAWLPNKPAKKERNTIEIEPVSLDRKSLFLFFFFLFNKFIALLTRRRKKKKKEKTFETGEDDIRDGPRAKCAPTIRLSQCAPHHDQNVC